MSGYSNSTNCPRCNGKNSLMTYSDWKPIDTISGHCLKCGLSYYTKFSRQITLTELNENRANYELKPLKKLPITKKFKEFDKFYF